MSTALDIHVASPAEVVAAHRNVFDIWSKGLGLDEHVRYRLESPSHRRATWYVGTLDSRVVTSLGYYPVEFTWHGQRLPGMAIGSVYTLAEFRGRGFAPKLIGWVERDQHARQVALSVLYSDIEPAYYARMGYALCPSPCGVRELSSGTPAPAAKRLVPLAAADHLDTVARLYAEYHGSAPLAFHRTGDYWTAILLKFGDDRFYSLQDDAQRWWGYVRVGRKGQQWRITDYALAEPGEGLLGELYDALMAEAAAEGASRIAGWLPDCAAARARFELAPRTTEITMIKPLAAGQALDADSIQAAGWFCEIDHV